MELIHFFIKTTKTFFLFFILLLKLVNFSLAKTIKVGKNESIKSIKTAITTANSFDTILINNGIYKEGNIIINKPLVLLGSANTILDGQLKYEIISIKANYVTVSGFKIQNSGMATIDDPGGIKVYDSHHVTIENNEFTNNFFGIYIQYGEHCTIKNNRISAKNTEEQQIGNGIHCWKSDSLIIAGNRIEGHRDGIYFEFVTGSVIWRNISVKNLRYGLHFMFSNNDSYISNVFKNNGAGVAVMFTNHVKMFNNYFENNWGDAAYGLLLKEIADAVIFNNRFIANTSGIYMEGTSRMDIKNNVFKNNGWGMKIQASCMDNNITYNNFMGNTFDVSTNGSLVLNTFAKNYWDKYKGYDLDKNKIGDVPYHPLSLFSVIVENNPAVMLLFHSFFINMLDESEKILPSLTPDNFIDEQPLMQAITL